MMNMKLRKRLQSLLFIAVMLTGLIISLAACANTDKGTSPSTGNERADTEAMTITFDSRGGSAVAAAEIGEDSTITMPKNPTWKKDYAFENWYTDKEYTTLFVNSGLSADTTVYAKWTKNGKEVRTEILNLYEATEDTSNIAEGWAWDAENRTLTLSGATLDTAQLDVDGSSVGMVLPYCPNASEDSDNSRHTHTQDCPATTILLTDGTVNTVDVSRAVNESYSAAIYADTSLTVKSSGNGTPGKLNVMSAQSKSISICLNIIGDLTVESGEINAMAGESTEDNSVGIGAYGGNIYIKNGTVTATGNTSGALPRGENPSGSFGLHSNIIQIDNGTVTATSGRAESALSTGILGTKGLMLGGGNITAKGDMAAVASFTELTLTGSIMVNGQAASIAEIKDLDPNKNYLHTFIDEQKAVLKDITIAP